MKSIQTFLLAFGLILASCEKGEGPGPELRRKTQEKLIGKWSVEKIVAQEYEPISTLKSTDQRDGTAEDYYSFKASNTVEIGVASNAKTEVTFEVINPYQIWIGDKYWRITELTDARLTLHIDRNDVIRNKRYMTTMYLYR